MQLCSYVLFFFGVLWVLWLQISVLSFLLVICCCVLMGVSSLMVLLKLNICSDRCQVCLCRVGLLVLVSSCFYRFSVCGLLLVYLLRCVRLVSSVLFFGCRVSSFWLIFQVCLICLVVMFRCRLVVSVLWFLGCNLCQCWMKCLVRLQCWLFLVVCMFLVSQIRVDLFFGKVFSCLFSNNVVCLLCLLVSRLVKVWCRQVRCFVGLVCVLVSCCWMFVVGSGLLEVRYQCVVLFSQCCWFCGLWLVSLVKVCVVRFGVFRVRV